MSDSQTDDDPRGPGAWIAALILVAVGVAFLFQNMGYAIPGNWWALFILIPAAFAVGEAWKAWVANDRSYGPGMTGPLVTAIILIALTLVFLLGVHVEWGVIWSVVLILVGVLALGRAYTRR